MANTGQKHTGRAKSGRISKVTIRQAQDALAILFPSVKCTVAPNGQNEIWVKDAHGYGFALTLGAGKAGVSGTMRKFAGAPPVTVCGNAADEHWTPFTATDAVEVSCTVYRTDEYSQAFRAWYQADAESKTNGSAPKHPDELGIKPIATCA